MHFSQPALNKTLTAKVELDRKAQAYTFIFILLIVAVCVSPLYLSRDAFLLVGIIFLIRLAMIYDAPKCITITDNEVIIRKIIGKKVIPYSDINQIERTSNPDLSWNLFASRGMMGYHGLFRSRILGQFHAYIGKPSDSILLLMKDDKHIIFSCANSDVIFQELIHRVSP